MVNVISKNQKFNISDSLYESILKNNPELLKEKETSDDPSNNVYSDKIKDDVDNKLEDIIKIIKNKPNYTNEQKEELIKRAKQDSERHKKEQLDKMYKELKNEIKSNKENEHSEENRKTYDRIQRDKKEKGYNPIINKNEDKPSDEELNSHAEKIYKILENYLFNSDIPDNILNFYGSVKKEFAKKTLSYGSFFLAKFYLFGDKKLKWIKETPKKMTVDYMKNSSLTIYGGEIWRLVKQMPMDDFWKNTAVISCNTEKSFSLVTSLINNIQNDRDEIDCFGKQIPTGFNTRTMVFTIKDKKPYEMKQLVDIRKRQNNNEMKSIMQKGRNDEKQEKENKLYNKEKNKDYYDLVFNNDEEITLNLLKNIKRQYYIIVTEGIFKKGKFLSDVSKKISKLLPSSSDIGNINLGSQ